MHDLVVLGSNSSLGVTSCALWSKSLTETEAEATIVKETSNSVITPLIVKKGHMLERREAALLD